MQALTRASQHSRERLRPVHWILVAKRETLSHKSIAYRSPIKTNSNTSTHRHICCWATFNRSIDFGSPFACIHILHRTNYNVTLMHTNKKILLLFIICNVVICRFICLWFGWLAGWAEMTLLEATSSHKFKCVFWLYRVACERETAHFSFFPLYDQIFWKIAIKIL